MSEHNDHLDEVDTTQEEELRVSARRRSTKDDAAPQSPLETYLREINETALLTANDEKELLTESMVGGK